jgi:hypothetical protein
MLIRSPAILDFNNNLDLMFFGVEYVAVSRWLGEVVLSSATNEELEKIELFLEKRVLPSKVWVLQAGVKRHFVVAASLKIISNLGNIFDSPFDGPFGK